MPGTQVCVVSSFAAVAEATGRVADFSSRMHHFLYRGEDGLPARLPFGEGTQILAVADPPVHTVHRQVVFPDLMARRMAELEPEVATAAEQCIDASLSAGTVDFMDTVANVVPITMISRLIGFRDHDREALLQAAIDSTALVGGRLSLVALQALLETSAETYSWIAEQLVVRCRVGRNDPRLGRARGAGGRHGRGRRRHRPRDLAERRRGVDDRPARELGAHAG